MSNVISCSSCGASNQLPEGKISMFCAFCGSAIQMKAEQNNTIPKPEENPQIKNYLELAKNAENSSNFDEAINYYNKALEYNPKLSEAWFGKGYCAGWSGNLRYIRVNEMVINFKKALDYASNQEQDSLKDQIVGAIDGCAFVVYKLSYDHTVEFARVDNTYQEHLERSMEILFALEYAYSLDPSSKHVLDSLIKISENLLTPISFKDYDGNTKSLSMENHSRNNVNDIRIKYSTQLALINPKYASEIEKKVQIGNVFFYIGVGGIALAFIFFVADNILLAIFAGIFSLIIGFWGFKTKSNYEGILETVNSKNPKSTTSGNSTIANAVGNIRNVNISNAIQKSKKTIITSVVIVAFIFLVILLSTDLFKNTSKKQFPKNKQDTVSRVVDEAKAVPEKTYQNHVTRDLSADNNTAVAEENHGENQNTETVDDDKSQGNVAIKETDNTQAHISTFTDTRDGHVYKSVKIGNQVWMAENLAYKPNNGIYWAYDNEQTNVNIYGYLYNWETAKNSCPNGWHLPSSVEWEKLSKYLGGLNGAGNKLKETGTIHWDELNVNATNITGFTALPGGRCFISNKNYKVGFSGKASLAAWWSSTECLECTGRDIEIRQIFTSGGSLNTGGMGRDCGMSVRCIKD